MKRCRIFLAFACAAGLLAAQSADAPELSLTVGKSRVLEIPGGVERVAVATAEVLEAVAISANQVLLNGRAAGETSLVVWARNAGYQTYDVHVAPSPARLERVRSALHREAGGDLDIEVEGDTVLLRGTAKDLSQSNRAAAIAANLGKVINLLRVDVPAADPEILLKIRFADVDRSASTELGANFFSTGATNTIGTLSTQQFNPPVPQYVQGKSVQFTISDALNLFLFRPDLDLGATIKALQTKNILQILAEPNLLALNGKEANFLAGGEFPYPVVQGSGTGLNTVTIQFREFGIRIKFVPTITPRGTIRLKVAPEVSTLDYANGLTYQGFTVPGLSVRRVSTEIELASGQSFAIAGLLDNRVTDTLSKVPGLGNIPFFGRLFQSRALSRNKSELLVVVTPEVVNPIPEGAAPPSLEMPQTFLKGGSQSAPGTGAPAAAPLAKQATLPVEQLLEQKLVDRPSPLEPAETPIVTKKDK